MNKYVIEVLKENKWGGFMTEFIIKEGDTIESVYSSLLAECSKKGGYIIPSMEKLKFSVSMI